MMQRMGGPGGGGGRGGAGGGRGGGGQGQNGQPGQQQAATAGQVDLTRVLFEAGSAELTENAIGVLNLISKSLTDQPGTTVKISGMIDLNGDGLRMRKQVLRDFYAEKLFGTGAKGQQLTQQQLEQQTAYAYDQMRTERAKAENKTPPPSVVGWEAAPSFSDMEWELMEATVIPNDRLLTLAKNRAEAVAEYLTIKKSCDPKMVQIVAIEVEKLGAERPCAALDLSK